MTASAIARVIVSTVLTVGLLTTFLTVRGRFVDARNWLAVPLVAWWLGPVAYYDWGAGALITAALVGTALVAAYAYLLVLIYRDKGSTAAIGLIAGPLLVWPALVLVVELSRIVS